MDLIIKPTEQCNFRCTFCSSTQIADQPTDTLDLNAIFRFIDRYPDLNTIIVNGGDPLMMPPRYYLELLDYLDKAGSHAHLSLTTNLWPFYKKPEKWLPVFTHPRVGITTSFQYGDKRLKGDFTPFSETDFWAVSDLMLEKVGYRPSFIAVIDEDNIETTLDTVRLAKRMNVQCKLNYLFASGPEVQVKDVTMGSRNHQLLLPKIYQVYLQVYREGLMAWEHNTQAMTQILREPTATICPLARDCDAHIRALQPSGDYYSCGAFGDDGEYPIDYEHEMAGGFERPLQQPELISLKTSCFTCPLFSLCNGCRKTIADLKRLGRVETHCRGMKALAEELIEVNGMTGQLEPTPYVDESGDDRTIPALQVD